MSGTIFWLYLAAHTGESALLSDLCLVKSNDEDKNKKLMQKLSPTFWKVVVF